MISCRGKELELTLDGFPTARLDFLPDTLVALDVAVKVKWTYFDAYL